jgi:hypothetical protein
MNKWDARELALAAAVEDAGDVKLVGEFVTVDFDDENRIATYLFEANLSGYLGWRWAVTVSKVDKDSTATLCDVVVLPGPDALVPPKWIPYRDRLQPGDVGVGDIVPSSLDDTRLTTGEAALPADEELDPGLAYELGLGRTRVLSIEGRDQAAKRWFDGERGPNSPMAQLAPKPCFSCGFFIPIAGSMRSAFGACANAISPEDGRVVSVAHGCGAHSEATF